MEIFLLMIKVQAELLVYLMVGIYAKKAGILDKEGNQTIINYLLKIALPCMVFESFNQQLTTQQLKSATLIILIAFAISFFSLMLGKLIWRKQPERKQAVLRYGTLISNAGFAGIPLVERAFGELGLFYGSIFVIPTRIFMWTFGISIFSKSGKKTNPLEILLNPGIVAVLLGLLRMLLHIPLPLFLDSSIKTIGSGTTALSMIAVGAIFGGVPIKSLMDKNVFAVSAVRLLLIPGVVLIALKVAHVDNIAASVAVILTGMPVGTTTSLLAQKYDADHEFAAKCVVVSTALSLATIPLLILFLYSN